MEVVPSLRLTRLRPFKNHYHWDGDNLRDEARSQFTVQFEAIGVAALLLALTCLVFAEVYVASGRPETIHVWAWYIYCTMLFASCTSFTLCIFFCILNLRAANPVRSSSSSSFHLKSFDDRATNGGWRLQLPLSLLLFGVTMWVSSLILLSLFACSRLFGTVSTVALFVASVAVLCIWESTLRIVEEARQGPVP